MVKGELVLRDKTELLPAPKTAFRGTVLASIIIVQVASKEIGERSRTALLRLRGLRPILPRACPSINAPSFKNQQPKPKQQPAQRPSRNPNAVPGVVGPDGLVHVDTRASNVDLDKYNEKYEQIAPSFAKSKDTDTKKQKLSQKSAQRKPFGARRETEADKLKRLALEKARKQQLKITVPDEITVGELASRLKVTASQVIKRLMQLGVMATVNEVIDYDTAEIVATELGAKVEHEVVVTIEERLFDDRGPE